MITSKNLVPLELIVQKLRNFKLDKSTLLNIQSVIKDPKTYSTIKNRYLDLLETPKGAWSASYIAALGVSLIALPPLVNSSIEIQKSISQYSEESRQIPFLDAKIKEGEKKQEALQHQENILAQYLGNSERILFFPEILRQSAEASQLKVISLRPVVNDQDDIVDSPEDYGQQSDIDNMPEDVPPGMPAPVIDDTSDPLMENFDAGFSDNQSAVVRTDITPVEYNIQVEGDYLRTLSFLKQLQSYQSFYSFKSAVFTTSSVSPSGESFSPVATTGEVILDLVIRIPTISGSAQQSPE